MAIDTVFFVLLPFVLIALAVTYYKTGRLSHLLYILSLYSYINTVAYAIDTFDLGGGGVTALLALSAVLLIGIGQSRYND